MKTAEIKTINNDLVLFIENKEAGKLDNDSQAMMDDCGEQYFNFVESTDLDDWGDAIKYKIVWNTLEAWDNKELNMDDESEACDWEKFEVFYEGYSNDAQVAQAL